MLITKNTSTGTTRGFIIKLALILAIVIGIIIMLGRIDFPSPSSKIEKIIPNEKLKIVK